MKQELSQESLEQFPLAIDALPEGWSIALIADVAHSVSPGFASGKHASDGNGYPHMRPMNIDRSGRIDLTVVKSVPSTEGRVLSPGDILFNNTNSPDLVGKTALIGEREAGFAFSNHMTRVRVDESISPGYVAHYLQFLWVSGYMKHRCTNHVNQASISSNTLAQTVPLLVPPSSEQLRIVEKLEELLSDIDAGAAELKAAQRKLALYRQSLLKAAVEGALTVDWRVAYGQPRETGTELLQRILSERRARWEQKQLAKFAEQGKTPPKGWEAKYPEPIAPDLADLPFLPDGWVWASLEQLGDVTTGFTPSTSIAAYFGGDIPFFKPTDLDAGYDVREYRESLTALGAEQGRVLPARSVLVTCIGATIGKTGLARVRCATNQQINAFSALEGCVVPEFVYFVLTSSFGQNKIISNASATTLPILNKSKFEKLPVPLPSTSEQIQIQHLLESALSSIAEHEAVIVQSLRQVEAQRKNLLKAAFAGQLVPQDPNDESASELLARIRAAREHVSKRRAGSNPAPATISPQSKRGRKAKEAA